MSETNSSKRFRIHRMKIDLASLRTLLFIPNCPVRTMPCYSLKFVITFLRKLCIRQNLRARSYSLKGSPYSITERRIPELILVLGSQPAGDVSHKLGGRQPLLSARPEVTLATLKRASTNFADLVNGATMGVNSLPKTVTDSVAAAI